MLKTILSIFTILISLTLIGQPDSLTEPPLFRDQTIIREDPPRFVSNSTYFLETDDFKIKIKCPTKVIIDSLDYIDQKIYQCEKGDVTLTIIQTTYDNGMYHSDSLKTLEFDLDYTQRKFIEGDEVKVIGTMARSIKGYPGKEFRYEYWLEDKITFRRVYIVKNTLYELYYEAPKNRKFHNEIDDFFDSFTLSNIENNPKFYLNMPSEEELKNLPYTANFYGKTIKKVEVGESFLGKSAIIVQGNEIRDKDNSGIISLMILHTNLPINITEINKKRIIDEQTKSLINIFPDTKILKNEYDNKGRKKTMFTYKIGGIESVIEERITFFQDNTMYLIMSLHRANQPKDKRIDQFFESFKLID